MAPLRGPLRRYYTPYEVAMHNSPDDAWVSFLGNVYNLTPLIKMNKANQDMLVKPLIQAAGQDISHWFDAKTRDVQKYIDPATNLERYYTPMGRFLHVPPAEPVSNWDTSFGIPWWMDKNFFIGSLTSRTRQVRIKNVLTSQEDILEIPSEETVAEIRERYLEVNWHAKSYTWKALVRKNASSPVEFEELDLNKTLWENGVPDETATFEDHMIPTDYYIPVLHLHWNDDLTIA